MAGGFFDQSEARSSTLTPRFAARRSAWSRSSNASPFLPMVAYVEELHAYRALRGVDERDEPGEVPELLLVGEKALRR